jgi:hypothetical protein
MQSTTPQQSSRGFVSPSAAPIKKTPDITDIISERETVSGGRCVVSGVSNAVSGNEVSEHTPHAANSTPLTENNFSENWLSMFNQVFASVPTIYFPLKETLPEIENNIIKITVKNEIQKEHFEAKKREVLEYLRTHFNEQVEDITVEANEQMATKKIIYDPRDKLQNFKEQNIEFEDFVQILDLKIKD